MYLKLHVFTGDNRRVTCDWMLLMSVMTKVRVVCTFSIGVRRFPFFCANMLKVEVIVIVGPLTASTVFNFREQKCSLLPKPCNNYVHNHTSLITEHILYKYVTFCATQSLFVSYLYCKNKGITFTNLECHSWASVFYNHQIVGLCYMAQSGQLVRIRLLTRKKKVLSDNRQ